MTTSMRFHWANRSIRIPAETLGMFAAALLILGAVDATERELEVEVQTTQPQAVTGRLLSFSLHDGAVVQSGVSKEQIPTEDMVRMTKCITAPQEFAGRKEPIGSIPDPDAWILTLTWGDVLTGRVIGAREVEDEGAEADEQKPGNKAARDTRLPAPDPHSTVIIETADLGEVSIPLENVARMTKARADSGVHSESLEWMDHGRSGAERAAQDDDRVLLTNGDVLRGFISAINANGIMIDGTEPIGPIPLRLVIAVRLAHSVPAAALRPYVILTLRDGARLTATGLGIGPIGPIETSRWDVKLRSGATVRVDADRVVSLDVIGGRWEWLCDPGTPDRHRPISYEQTSMLGPGWEYLAGRNVLNGPILVAGDRHERGIGVHSRSKLVFELNGGYREFVTSFGMDDDSGPLADVTVVLLVDGQRRFEKTHVRRGTLHGPVRVDVSRAGRIELLVDYGDNGDLQDRFDWVEPGLIR